MSAAGRGGAAAPFTSDGKHPRARRPRWVRGLLTLAGALAVSLALGALTSTAGAQGSSPVACEMGADVFRRANIIPDVFGPGGNFSNYVENGANWREDGINFNNYQGRSSNKVHGPCTTSRLGRAVQTAFPIHGGGLFLERFRVWTDSDRNDSYLRLYSANGTLIAEDDDSGEGYNAFISMRVDGRPDRFVGEGDSNIPGTPVDWRVADGRGTSQGGNYRSLYLEIGTYGPQPSYDSSVSVHVEIDFGAPWGSDLAAGIVAQLGGLPPTGIQMTGFPTAEAAISKRDTGEAFVAARFFDDTDGDHAKQGAEALDTANADLWFLKSPRGGVIYRRTSSLSTRAAAAHNGEHTGIRGSESNANTVEWHRGFRGGDRSRTGQFAGASGTSGNYAYGMVPVFRYDYDPALAATGDPRAMNDTGLDRDGDDICTENGTESAVISLAYLSGAVNQYMTCVPKRGVDIKPRGLSLDEGDTNTGGDMSGTFRDDSDRLEPVGYFVVQFDEDNDYGLWPIVIDLNGAPHPKPGSDLTLGAPGSSGPTLQVSGLKDGLDSPLHPDSDDADTDWALQILIDDETANMGTTTCLQVAAADLTNRATWSEDLLALDAHLSSLRIPKAVSDLRRGTVLPLSGPLRNEPLPLRVGEFWVREFDPWFTGSAGSKVLNLNRASSHARNEIYHRHPGLRAANELTPTGFNFRSERCYAVSIRYMEVDPGTDLPVGKGLKLRKELVAP